MYTSGRSLDQVMVVMFGKEVNRSAVICEILQFKNCGPKKVDGTLLE